MYPDVLESAGYFIGLTGKGYGPGTNKGRLRNAAGPDFKTFDAFLAARPKDKPFCFWFGSHFPHRAYEMGSGVKHGMDPAKVVVPPCLPDIETVRSDICDYYDASQSFDRQCGEALAALDVFGTKESIQEWERELPSSKATAGNRPAYLPVDQPIGLVLASAWLADVRSKLKISDTPLAHVSSSWVFKSCVLGLRRSLPREHQPVKHHVTMRAATAGWADRVGE